MHSVNGSLENKALDNRSQRRDSRDKRIKRSFSVQLIKYFFIFAVCLFWPFFVSYADIQQNIKIQSYLNALGYNVGQIDGIIGKNSRKQLITVLKEHGLELSLIHI